MKAVIVTFPDTTSLGQAPATRAPYLTATQTKAQVQRLVAQQQQPPFYLRRIPQVSR